MRHHWIISTLVALCGCAMAQPFAYDIHIDSITETEGGLSLDAFVRIGGEPYTKIRFSVSSESVIRKPFDSKRATGDLEYSYFRMETKEKIPEALPERVRPRLDIITKEVMRDLALNEEHKRKSVKLPAWDGHLAPFPLDEKSIISVSEISQNEFLGIKPKIVVPQAK